MLADVPPDATVSRALLQTPDGQIHGLALDLMKPITLPSGARCSRIVFRLPTQEDFARADHGADTQATMAAMFERLTGRPGADLGRLGMRDWNSAVETMSLLLDAFNDAQMRAAMEVLPPGHS
jgi:hypothetical protein